MLHTLNVHKISPKEHQVADSCATEMKYRLQTYCLGNI